MSEGAFTCRVLEELRNVPWATPLVHEIENRGGITYVNKPLLFEARVRARPSPSRSDRRSI